MRAFTPSAPAPTSASRPLFIRELPPAERPRDRLRRLGAEALTTAELLSIVLGSGTRGRSVLDVSRDLLRTGDQSLGALAAHPLAALAAVHGVGAARAAAIHAALELGRRRWAELRGGWAGGRGRWAVRRRRRTGRRSVGRSVRLRRADGRNGLRHGGVSSGVRGTTVEDAPFGRLDTHW